MPVRKYVTHADAHRADWLKPGDARIPERVRQVLHLGEHLYPIRRPPGVHRFRTLADAQAWRKSWEWVKVSRERPPTPG